MQITIKGVKVSVGSQGKLFANKNGNFCDKF